MNARPPSRCSTGAPKTYSMNMFSTRCSRPACTNMYVTKVHGRCSASAGENLRASCRAGEVKTVMSSSSTTALAMMRRPTQGVSRLEGDRLIDLRFLELRSCATARPGASADPLAQLRELDPHRTGRLRQETRGRHTGQGVYL